MVRAPKSGLCRLAVVIALVGMAVVAGGCRFQMSARDKVADFEYLFNILKENDPSIDLNKRAENYDWESHYEDFKKRVTESRNDLEFAEAIGFMLLSLNNGHTYVGSGDIVRTINLVSQNEPVSAWLEELKKTTESDADYWYGLATKNLNQANNGFLPFQARYVDGGYAITAVSNELRSAGVVPGAEVSRINGDSVDSWVASMRGSRLLRYDPIHRKVYEWNLEYGGSKPLTVTFTGDGAATVDLKIEPASGYVGLPLDSPVGIGTQNIYTEILGTGEEKVGYLHVSEMTTLERSGSEAFQIRDFLTKAMDTRALIIDVRGNGGGDDRFWVENLVQILAKHSYSFSRCEVARSGQFINPFLDAYSAALPAGTSVQNLDRNSLTTSLTPKQLSNVPPEVMTSRFRDPVVLPMVIEPSKDALAYDGKIVVLTDRRVYSSTVNFVDFCVRTGWATVVGEPVASDNTSITPAVVVLPKSRMLVMFPAAMGLSPSWTANEELSAMPQVPVYLRREQLLEQVHGLESANPRFDVSNDPILQEALRVAMDGQH